MGVPGATYHTVSDRLSQDGACPLSSRSGPDGTTSSKRLRSSSSACASESRDVVMRRVCLFETILTPSS